MPKAHRHSVAALMACSYVFGDRRVSETASEAAERGAKAIEEVLGMSIDPKIVIRMACREAAFRRVTSKYNTRQRIRDGRAPSVHFEEREISDLAAELGVECGLTTDQ